MAKQRKKARMPARLLLLWSASEQQRLIDTVERLHTAIGDLQEMLGSEMERRAIAARKAAETRRRRESILGSLPAQNGDEPGPQ